MPRSTIAVPRVGCPPNGISSFGTKILTLTPLLALGCGVPRKDERGFLKVGLARQILHFLVTQTARVQEYGQRIALQAPRCEHIDLNAMETADAIIGI
jgi:hypothetical protein